MALLLELLLFFLTPAIRGLMFTLMYLHNHYPELLLHVLYANHVLDARNAQIDAPKLSFII